MNQEDYKIAYENVMVANKMLEREIVSSSKERQELLVKIEDLKKQIEILVKDDEYSQQTIINQKQEIDKLDNIIMKIYTKALDTSITSIDLRDYIISSLGSGKIDKRSNN